jgi:transposase-like protein
MLQMTLTCKKCGSTALRKNGSLKGEPKYQCTACRYQAVFTPAAARKAAQYAQVEKLLVERVSQRAIVRLTGVSRPTIVKLAKKSASATSSRPPTEPPAHAGVG